MYSKVLQKIVADANITQEELSNRCKELGTPISRGQINKILNNKAPAPEESISRSIAKICNVDDRELVIEGYLEKAPKEFLDFLHKFQDLLSEIGISFFEPNLNKEQNNMLKELYKKETITQTILGILDEEETIEINSNSVIFEDKENGINITFNDFYCIVMEDDSMENKIPKGSKLKIKIKEKYKNGDIVLVKVKGKDKPVVRVVFFIGKDICLNAYNNKYDSLYLKEGDYTILSAVSSFEIKI